MDKWHSEISIIDDRFKVEICLLILCCTHPTFRYTLSRLVEKEVFEIHVT